MLDALDYVEVETPVLSAQPGGAEAKPFLTYHNSLDVSAAGAMGLLLPPLCFVMLHSSANAFYLHHIYYRWLEKQQEKSEIVFP